MGHSVCFAFALVVSGCASVVPAGAPDVLAPDAPAPDVLAPDAPAPDVLAPDVPAPDVPAPDVLAPDDVPDGGSAARCAPVALVEAFGLVRGAYGTGRLVFDARRRAVLLVSVATGELTRVAPEGGALTRLTPVGYPSGVARAEAFLDEAADALVVVPLPDAPRGQPQVLTLNLAAPDRWETRALLTATAPSLEGHHVAGFAPNRRLLRLVGADAMGSPRREVWDLRFLGSGWAWTRRMDFVAPRIGTDWTALWDPTRESLLVLAREASAGPWGAWALRADGSERLPVAIDDRGQLPLAVYDTGRQLTWTVTPTATGAALAAFRSDAASAVRSVAVGPPSRPFRAVGARPSLAFDAAGRRLYVYADYTASGAPSVVASLDVDRCLPR